MNQCTMAMAVPNCPDDDRPFRDDGRAASVISNASERDVAPVTTTMNLEELLSSDSMSKVFLTPDGGSSPQLDQFAARGDLRNMNAAKLSLLLVRALTSEGDHCSERLLAARDFRVKWTSRPPGMSQTTGGFPEIQGIDDHCEERRVLLAVELIRREKNDGDWEDQPSRMSSVSASFMQDIGRIIHSIFATGRGGSMTEPSAAESVARVSFNGSCNSSFNSSMNSSFNSSFVEDEEDENNNGRRLSHRSRRRSDGHSSLFSILVETGECPIAVCRLISDMMDSSCGGIPFLSLEEVARDLEQMSNDPQVFLFDQGGEFYLSNLLFGQGYFGRVKELTTLLEISNRIEAPESGERSTAASTTTAATATSNHGDLDVVFVSGPAGSGKSHFVRFVGTSLSNLGWTVLRARFKRTLEHESREIVSSLFCKLVANIVEMKDSEDKADVVYHRQATEAISDQLDPAGLSCLANFVPTLRELIPDIDKTSRSAEVDHWQLVFLLSKLLGAILSIGRRILICLDDLQWCDATTLTLIKEIIMSVGMNQQGESHLLVIGMYRDNEISESHPFAGQLASLKKSRDVHVTEIELSSLTKNDVADMIMTETRLPRRLVSGLAEIVHKKTSGHAMFVVQLLNSLVRDSMIAYSPRRRRFDWDEGRIAMLGTWDSVASLIVANVNRLRSRELQSLRILSCFGVQSDLTLIKLLNSSPVVLPGGGIEPVLPSLVERGILDVSGPSVTFSHDLIQQHVYGSIPVEERRQLHLDIGVYLGSMTVLDAHSQKNSIEGGVDQLYLSDGSSTTDSVAKPSTLISIVTDQVNAAGPEFVVDGAQRTRFAGWNLHAGKEAAESSNFESALFNYKNGIAFLADGVWLGDATYQLCRELHEGAAFASFALGDAAGVERYAEAIIENVPFEDSLVARALRIRSLNGAGRYAETIATGLAVLRLLKIDIPSSPSPKIVYEAMTETGRVASQYTSDQIANMSKSTSINARKRNVLKIADAVTVACYREASPYLPLVTCAMVDYSLQNGVCEESAIAFVVYGYFKIFVQSNFDEGRRWGDIALKILDPNSAFTPMVLYGFLLFWFIPHQKVASTMADTYEAGMRVGDVDSAMYALCLSMRFSFFGGTHLSILSQSYAKSLEQMAKYNKECLQFTIVDLLVVQGLTGIDNCPFSIFEGMIQDEDVLLADAKHRKNAQGLEAIYSRRFFSAFWSGDYAEANKWCEQARALPSSRMPKVQMIHATLYCGLIAFQLYRDGEGEKWLDEGKAALDKFELWEGKMAGAMYENKLYLLEAEHYASMCNIVASKESYELSAKTARDNGLVHEQGLAYELYGKFLSSIADPDASQWLERARVCYVQWGAVAKADQLQKDHNLGLPPNEVWSTSINSIKHDRDEQEELF